MSPRRPASQRLSHRQRQTRSVAQAARVRRSRIGSSTCTTPSESSAVDPLLAAGVALYNRHQFFECHEVLERRWLKTHDRSKDFYKGLIQAAVAYYHWSGGNLAGALTLARSASRYLARYRPTCCGVDVDGFVTTFSELFQWLRRHRQRYDPRLVPMIRWVTPNP